MLAYVMLYISYGAKSEANAIKQAQMSLLSPHTNTHTLTLSSLPCALTNQANNSGFHNRTKRGDGGQDRTGRDEGVWDEGQKCA